MKNKKALVLSAIIALAAGAITCALVGSGNSALLNVSGEDHAYAEKAYDNPTTSEPGLKAYYMDTTTCATAGPGSSRYEYKDYKKSPQVLTNISMESLTIPALTGAEAPTGDLITAINPAKYKYLDQGVNGVDGTGGTTTPFYVSDAGHTALFMSRSGKTGDQLVTMSNTDCSEFRFTSDKAVATSITFSYRYLDYGTGYWHNDAGAPTASDPGQINDAHFMIQMKDSGSYFGQAVTLTNDDAWHTITVSYADAAYHWVGGAVSTDAATYTTNLTDIIFKFVDLRGHIYVSGLSTSATGYQSLDALQNGTSFANPVTSSSNVITYTGSSLTINPSWVKTAVAEGYTHLRFHAAATPTSGTIADIKVSDSVSDSTYSKTNVSDNDVRITLSTINGDNGGIKIVGRTGDSSGKTEAESSFTISDFHLYKSSETLSWAKGNATGASLSTYTNYTDDSHLYVAYEDGELVIDNIGGNAYEKVTVLPAILFNSRVGANSRLYYKFLESTDGNCYDGTSLRSSDKKCYAQCLSGSTTLSGGSDADNDEDGYSYMTRSIENGNGIVLGLSVPTAMKFKVFDLSPTVTGQNNTAPATANWCQMPNSSDGSRNVKITDTAWHYYSFFAPSTAKKVVITMKGNHIIENGDPGARFTDLADGNVINFNTIAHTESDGIVTYASTTLTIEGTSGFKAVYGCDGDGNTEDMPKGTSITAYFNYYFTY